MRATLNDCKFHLGVRFSPFHPPPLFLTISLPPNASPSQNIKIIFKPLKKKFPSTIYCRKVDFLPRQKPTISGQKISTISINLDGFQNLRGLYELHQSPCQVILSFDPYLFNIKTIKSFSLLRIPASHPSVNYENNYLFSSKSVPSHTLFKITYMVFSYSNLLVFYIK